MELENYTLSSPGALSAWLSVGNRIPGGTLAQVRHGESVLWRTRDECCAFGAKHTQKICPARSSLTRILTFIPRTSTMTFMHGRLFIAIFFAYALVFVAHAQDGPKNSVVLIIRHAENGGVGHGLAPRGEQRAEAYKNYFLNFAVDSKRREPQAIFAAKDSSKSHRPRLTVEPFAKAANLKIDTRFGNNQSTELAADLRANQQGKVILICWRHPYIPALLRALGAEPKTFLPNGKWPGSVYDWVILLSFDHEGRLIPASSRRINEHLMPGDSQ